MPLEKVRKLFISALPGDETLFGAFTIQREQPDVVLIVFDPVPYRRRRLEITRALQYLDAPGQPLFAGVPDTLKFASLTPALKLVNAAISAALAEVHLSELEQVWYPAIETPAGYGDPLRELVSMVAGSQFKNAKKTRYLTRAGGRKSTDGEGVQFDGDMLRRKLKALACYDSMLKSPTFVYFASNQYEYTEHVQAFPLGHIAERPKKER